MLTANRGSSPTDTPPSRMGRTLWNIGKRGTRSSLFKRRTNASTDSSTTLTLIDSSAPAAEPIQKHRGRIPSIPTNHPVDHSLVATLDPVINELTNGKPSLSETSLIVDDNVYIEILDNDSTSPHDDESTSPRDSTTSAFTQISLDMAAQDGARSSTATAVSDSSASAPTTPTTTTAIDATVNEPRRPIVQKVMAVFRKHSAEKRAAKETRKESRKSQQDAYRTSRSQDEKSSTKTKSTIANRDSNATVILQTTESNSDKDVNVTTPDVDHVDVSVANAAEPTIKVDSLITTIDDDKEQLTTPVLRTVTDEHSVSIEFATADEPAVVVIVEEPITTTTTTKASVDATTIDTQAITLPIAHVADGILIDINDNEEDEQKDKKPAEIVDITADDETDQPITSPFNSDNWHYLWIYPPKEYHASQLTLTAGLSEDVQAASWSAASSQQIMESPDVHVTFADEGARPSSEPVVTFAETPVHIEEGTFSFARIRRPGFFRSLFSRRKPNGINSIPLIEGINSGTVPTTDVVVGILRNTIEAIAPVREVQTVAKSKYDEDQLKKAMTEFIQTEYDFIVGLDFMYQHYYLPLLHGIKKQMMTELFGTFCDLYTVYQYQILPILIHHPMEAALKKVITAIPKYIDYFKNLSRALYVLEHDVQPYLEELKLNLSSSDVGKLRDLKALIITPIQRLTRYPLLLERILRYEGPESDTFEAHQQAYIALQNSLLVCNQVAGEAQERFRSETWCRRIDSSFVQTLTSPEACGSVLLETPTMNRQFIGTKPVVVTKVCSTFDKKNVLTKMKSCRATLVFFTDMVCWCAGTSEPIPAGEYPPFDLKLNLVKAFVPTHWQFGEVVSVITAGHAIFTFESPDLSSWNPLFEKFFVNQ